MYSIQARDSYIIQDALCKPATFYICNIDKLFMKLKVNCPYMLQAVMAGIPFDHVKASLL